MSEQRTDDSAWVRIPSGLSQAELLAFCQDAERLLRINSMYEFQEWRREGGGRFFMRIRNLSNGLEVETPLRVELHPNGTRIVYEFGLKTATDFRIEPASAEQKPGQAASSSGAVLIVTDDYSGTPEAERQARIGEIDKSLVWWGHDLHRYLRLWARWSKFSLWRWYMRRIWQPMKPTARRIAFVLIAITVFEFMVGILVILAFAFGWDDYFLALLGGGE